MQWPPLSAQPPTQSQCRCLFQIHVVCLMVMSTTFCECSRRQPCSGDIASTAGVLCELAAGRSSRAGRRAGRGARGSVRAGRKRPAGGQRAGDRPLPALPQRCRPGGRRAAGRVACGRARARHHPDRHGRRVPAAVLLPRRRAQPVRDGQPRPAGHVLPGRGGRHRALLGRAHAAVRQLLALGGPVGGQRAGPRPAHPAAPA